MTIPVFENCDSLAPQKHELNNVLFPLKFDNKMFTSKVGHFKD